MKLLNRETLGWNRILGKWYPLVVKWRFADVCLLVVVAVIDAPVAKVKPFQRQFYINDLGIAHPHASPETVPYKELMLYATALPFVIITVTTLVLADSRHRWYLCYASLLSLMLSVYGNNLLTDFLKNWVGRLRPDFLVRCIPKEGVPKDTLVYAKDVCTTKNMAKLYDGFRTLPSGHSSISFSGLGFLYFWLCGQLMTEAEGSSSWRKVIACIPLIGATVIALSRTQDYRHHFVDVVLGSCLGFIVAWWVYRKSFPSIFATDKDCFKPYLDNSSVTMMKKKSTDSETADSEVTVDQKASPLVTVSTLV